MSLSTEYRLAVMALTSDQILRNLLKAMCEKEDISLLSAAEPGEPARNFELVERLGLPSSVFEGDIKPEEIRDLLEIFERHP